MPQKTTSLTPCGASYNNEKGAFDYGLVDWAEASFFINQLIENKYGVWVLFPPEEGKFCLHYKRKEGERIPYEAIGKDLQRNKGWSLGYVINPPKEEPKEFKADPKNKNKVWGAKKEHIKGATLLFVEGDGGLSKEEQLRTIHEALPIFQPSFIVDTGGKSLHFYWKLTRMVSPEKFEEIQKRLVRLIKKVNPSFGIDESLCKSNQLLRIPGGLHGKTNKRSKLYRIGGWLHDENKQPYWELCLRYGVEFFEQGLSVAEYVWEVETTGYECDWEYNLEENKYYAKESNFKWIKDIKEEKGIKDYKPSFISQQALSKDGQWFSRLEREVQLPLAVEMLQFVPKREEIGRGDRRVCISILYGLKRHFGELDAATICEQANWRSDYWNPTEELPSLQNPTNDIGTLVTIARKGGWIYETSKVLNKGGVKLEQLFPTPIINSLRVVTRLLPYPDHLIATTYLASICPTLKLGTSLNCYPITDFVVTLNLYIATVGESGSKKTPLLKNLIENPLALVKQEMKQKYKNEVAKFAQADHENEELEAPPHTLLYMQDVTPEACEVQLEQQEKAGLSILYLKDELSGLFSGLDAYKGGRGSAAQQLLEQFDGRGFSTIRKKERRECDKTQLSIYGNVQPKILAELQRGGDSSGQWARFLYSPNPTTPKRLPATITKEEKQEHEVAKEHLQKVALALTKLPPFEYQLNEEAIKKFTEYLFEKEEAMFKAKNSELKAIFGKSGNKVGKVCGCLHVIKNYENPEELVTLETLEAAITLVDYLDEFAIKFQKESTETEEDRRLRRLMAITWKYRKLMAWRDIKQRLTEEERAKWNQETCIDSLKKLAYMDYGEVKEGKKGGLHFKAVKEYKK